MAEASRTVVMNVSKEKLWAAIMNFEAYPEFVEGMRDTQIVEEKEDCTRVQFDLSIMGKQIQYVLDHYKENDTGLRWNLVDSKFFKSNEGNWELKDLGDGRTEVTYRLALDFSFSVPGLVLKGVVKKLLPKMMSSFEDRAGSI